MRLLPQIGLLVGSSLFQITPVIGATCDGFAGVIASAVSKFSDAQNFCTSKYPVAPVTMTAPNITITSTANTTTTTLTAPTSTFITTVATNTLTTTVIANTTTLTSIVTVNVTTSVPATVTVTVNPQRKRSMPFSAPPFPGAPFPGSPFAAGPPAKTSNSVSTVITRSSTVAATTAKSANTSSITAGGYAQPAVYSLFFASNALASSVCGCIESTKTVTTTPTTIVTSTPTATATVTPSITLNITATSTSTVLSTVTTTTFTTTDDIFTVTSTVTATATAAVLPLACNNPNNFCASGTNCYCNPTTDGQSYCLNYYGACGAGCSSNSDCPSGQVCGIFSNCNSCSTSEDESDCGNAAAPARLFAIRSPDQYRNGPPSRKILRSVGKTRNDLGSGKR